MPETGTARGPAVDAPVARPFETGTADRALVERHLDLGCGDVPRNPYRRRHLFGVDVRDVDAAGRFVFSRADLAFEPIPFDADSFASVSAFDFLEHVPRVLNGPLPSTTIFPFVRLMDEVWRVLAPGACSTP